MSLEAILLGTLAVWRVTHLLQAEDGPWNLGLRLRQAAESGFWGQLLDCFYCLSLWVAVPVSLLLAPGWREGVLLWLGLSGGAILLQRLSHRSPSPPYEEEYHAVLWRETTPAPPDSGEKPNHPQSSSTPL
ncbi:MAG: DUF1360 domain-containing protein [Thermaceae bacterium]|nr:DUF1360 domain-containing protein [Thermaceae bacterium]